MTDHPASWARTEVRPGTFGGSQQTVADEDMSNLQAGESHPFILHFLPADPPPPANAVKLDLYVKAQKPTPAP